MAGAAAQRLFKRIFDDTAELAVRQFPTEAAARESLAAFKNSLHGSTPVDGVMKRLFGEATVREVAATGGENTAFRILLRPNGVVVGEESVHAAIRGLRRGDLDSVARALDVTPARLGTRSFRADYTRYVRDVFPDVRVAEQVVAAEKALSPRISAATRELRPETADDLLRAIKRDDELHGLVVRLAEHVRKNGGRRGFRYASTFFALSGVAGTVAAVVSALHEQARRSAGCWRFYLDPVTKELRGCKILQASCRNGTAANETAVCDRTPISFRADMCRGVESECVNCDPTADPASAQYISPAQYLEPDDLYVCRPVASVGEMLGRIVADVPDLARDAVVDIAGTVSRAWDSVKYFVLAGGGMLVAVLFLYAYITLRRERRARNDGDDDDESRSLLRGGDTWQTGRSS